MKRLAHLAELEVLGLDGLLDQMVLLWPHLDGRGGGGGGRLLQAVQHLPDVELLHFSEHRIKGDGHFSLTPWYKHAQRRALRPPDFGSHVSASSSAQSPSLEGCDARLVDVQGWMDGSWDGLIVGRRFGSLMCVSAAPLLARRLCFPPLPSLSGLMCAPLSQGGNAARCCCCRCCACLTEPRFQRKSRHLSNLSLSFPLCLLLSSARSSPPTPPPLSRLPLSPSRWVLRHCTGRWLLGCCSGVKEPDAGRIRPILPSSPLVLPLHACAEARS